jgi:hypothetical protein
MDILLFYKTLFSKSNHRLTSLGKDSTKNKIQITRESGEVVIPLIFTVLIGSFLFGSLFWLNKHFQQKTQEHLSGFKKDWNNLQKKYQD